MNIWSKVIIFLLFSLLAFTKNTIAQTPSYIHLNVDDGLPGSTVYGAVQDSLGYMWFATNNGVCRYDGTVFKNYESPLIEGQEIIDIYYEMNIIWFVDLKGRVFYIEDDKIFIFDNKEIRNDSNNKVISHIKGTNVLTIVSGGGKFYKYVSDNTMKSPIAELKPDSIFIFKKANNSGYGNTPITINNQVENILHGTLGLTLFNYNAKENKLIQEHEHYHSVLESSKSKWRNEKNRFPGLYNILIDNNTEPIFEEIINRYLTIRNDFPIPATDILCHSNGHILMTNSTNLLIKKQHSETYEKLNWFNSGINVMFEDRQKGIWFCSKEKGIFYISNLKNSLFNAKNSKLPFDYITKIKGNEKYTFIASNNGWFSRLENNNIHSIKLGEGNSTIYNFHIHKDGISACYEEGVFIQHNSTPLKKSRKKNSFGCKDVIFDGSNYWIANSRLISKFTNDTSYLILHNRAYTLVWDKYKQIIWCGGSNGFFALKDINFTNYSTAITPKDTMSDIPKERIVGIFLRSKNRLHKSTIQKNNKFLIYKNNVLQKTKDIDVYVSDIEILSDTTKWISTHGEGVYVYKDKIVKHYTTENGLTSNICYSLSIDKDENIWVATNKGANIIRKDGSIQNITMDDGLISNEVTSIYRRDSIIYIGTPKGLNTFPESAIFQENPAPAVLLQSIKINEIEQSIDKALNLNHKENNLYIQFVGISYTGNLKYKYRLKGLQSNWIITNENYIRFTSLPPGDYTLQVKAIRSSGLESYETTNLPIYISVPYWKAIWFRLSLFFLGLLAMYLWFRRRLRKISEKSEIDKKIASLELQALQAQMNPHFVFNSLNSIQSFIIKEDSRKANKYLSKFAKLMRLFLDASHDKYISLSEEQNLIKLYVEMEQIRFGNKFDVQYNINIVDDYEIPSMVLQPFIENAINHGLAQRDSKGLLFISITTEEDHISCIIEDDGIGREKSKTLQSELQKPYKSRAMKIVDERMRIINEMENSDIQINIIDKKDAKGIGIGTKIIINIPIK